MKLLANEGDRIVKIKVEVSEVEFKFEKKGRQSEVLELAILALQHYKKQVEEGAATP